MKLSSPTSARIKRTVVLAALAGITATQLTACFPLFAGAVAGGVAMATDRRPTATQTIDRGLQLEAENTLITRYNGRAHVNVTVYNRKVLLTGEAGSEQTKQEIGQYAQKLENAREVVNELVVTGESSTLSSRTNDTYITAKVKSVLAGAEGVPWNSIKVTTEAQTVFLMGVVTEAEGNRATEAARTVGGVAKVVKVFDYVSDEERKRLDANATSTNPQVAPSSPSATATSAAPSTERQAPAPVTSASPGVTVSPTNSPALPPGKQLP